VLTADCLPLLLCDREATVVAAVHAGWRGLYDDIIAAAVAALPVPPASLMAWIGPAIGVEAYRVDENFCQRFLARYPRSGGAFVARADGLHADLALLARQRFAAAGVHEVHHCGLCTHADPQRFYSHRRDGVTGRQATLVWLQP
jgi:YfiH family protein